MAAENRVSLPRELRSIRRVEGAVQGGNQRGGHDAGKRVWPEGNAKAWRRARAQSLCVEKDLLKPSRGDARDARRTLCDRAHRITGDAPPQISALYSILYTYTYTYKVYLYDAPPQISALRFVR